MAHAGHNSVYEAAPILLLISAFFPRGDNERICLSEIHSSRLCCRLRGRNRCQAGKTLVVKSDSRRGSWTRESVSEMDRRKG